MFSYFFINSIAKNKLLNVIIIAGDNKIVKKWSMKMFINQVNSFNNKAVNFGSKMQMPQIKSNVLREKSIVPNKVVKTSMWTALAFLVALGGASIITSCSNPTSSTNNSSSTDGPVTPPTNPVTQSPVQKDLIMLAKTLGICPSTTTADITDFSYTDGNELTSNSLTLNTKDSTQDELIFDGTSLDKFFGATKTIRYILTLDPKDGQLVINRYNTGDGNPASSTNPWINYSSNKYIADSANNCINKYSLNDDGTTKDLISTITPESDTSLLVNTTDGNIYEITDISIKTKQ